MQTTTVKSPKVYVAVKTDFAADGTMFPREVTWENGEKFEVDRVLDIWWAAAMKAGCEGDRYTIIVHGKQRYLFFERNTNLNENNIGRWFVERKRRFILHLNKNTDLITILRLELNMQRQEDVFSAIFPKKWLFLSIKHSK